MSKHEINHSEWSRFLDEFSRQHEGWLAELKVQRPDVGDKIEAENLPFHGITYDVKGSSRNNVSIFLGEGMLRDETHNIANPTHIRFEQSEEGTAQALEVESEDGAKAIVRFQTPPKAAMEDRI